MGQQAPPKREVRDMKKLRLSPAQERVLNLINETYDKDLKHQLETYRKEVEEEEWNKNNGFHLPEEYYREHLKYAEQGFILWQSWNCKTLEKLDELGFIQYIKADANRQCTPMDLVKLIVRNPIKK